MIIIKAVRADLPRDLKYIEIHIFADLHIGDKFCDMQLIKSRIDYIEKTSNAYCILNGDLMNNATKTSMSDSYAEDIPPMEQIQKCVSLFGPIKDKILCVQSGNHESRTYKKEGIDLTEVMCHQLGLADKFSKGASILFLRFGEINKKESNGSGNKRKMCYTILCNHGTGGGRKEGAKAIRLADMAAIADTDIYIHSHTHLPFVMKQAFYRVDPKNSTINLVDKLFVNTAATLGYGGYGEVFEYKPSSKENPVIILDGTKKGMVARL